uniref:non-specific serine/threonine protein kinase n=1 Tax=Tanacetum cinerariifolium TaxID=118510 RepID=A0A6L2NVA6_TANCI|nr:zinc finger, CCHC-type [Tanacetum cinerariifolium]
MEVYNRGQAEREFKVEVEAIGRVRHKNLVRLLGYCVEGAYSGGGCLPQVSHLGWGRWYTLRELEAATNGLDDANVIGEGGYGIVYSGVLGDNTLVAVKNLLNNRDMFIPVSGDGGTEYTPRVSSLTGWYSSVVAGDEGENPNMEQVRRRAKWDNDDYVCRGLILNDLKHTLQHLKDELTLIELSRHLRIEEPLRVQDSDKPKGNNVARPSVVNMVKHNNSSRLGHVHFKRMQDMSKDGLISAIDMDIEKCKTCILNKLTKKPFQNVKCEAKVLELIHSDLCDLHATLSLGNKKYFVTFIDDASREAVRLPNPKLKNLGEKGIEYIFVGYAEHSKTFRFSFILKSSQRSMVKGTEDSGGSVVSERVTDEIVQQSEPQLRKGKRHKMTLKYLMKKIKSQDVAFWKEAINDEMDSIMGNNTWVLTNLPPGCKPLGCKWIFKRKLKVDGTVEKFKARLVIQGFKKKSGIEYFDTYAPVARISTIRLLIAMASIHNLIIHQMDVKTTFLNRELEEEVYMNQPLGFIMPGNENKVCKLSLYGLKQAPKQWHQNFDEVILSKVYLLNQTDKCGSDQGILSSRFSMKDIGETDVILGIRIKHESNGIAISHSHYIEMVMKKFNYSDCTPVSTLLDTCEKLMPNRGLVVSQLEYSRVIGCLMYDMTCTKPDIAFAVGKMMLEGYTDASWISNTEDNSSTSGWVFLIGGGAISWASKKQTCITGSTMESEFVALAAASKEAEWLKNLLLKILYTKMKDINWGKVKITDELMEYVIPKYGKCNWREDNSWSQIILDAIYNTFYKDEAEADEEA